MNNLKDFNLTPREPHGMRIAFPGSNKLGRNFCTRYPVLVQHYLVLYGMKPVPWIYETANITKELLNAVLFCGAELLTSEFVAIVQALNSGRYNPLALEYFASPIPVEIDPISTRFHAKCEKLKRRRADLAQQFATNCVPFNPRIMEIFRSVNITIQVMSDGDAISNAEYWWAFESLYEAKELFNYEIRKRFKRAPRGLESKAACVEK